VPAEAGVPTQPIVGSQAPELQRSSPQLIAVCTQVPPRHASIVHSSKSSHSPSDSHDPKLPASSTRSPAVVRKASPSEPHRAKLHPTTGDVVNDGTGSPGIGWLSSRTKVVASYVRTTLPSRR